jgi:hypothetical protein
VCDDEVVELLPLIEPEKHGDAMNEQTKSEALSWPNLALGITVLVVLFILRFGLWEFF